MTDFGTRDYYVAAMKGVILQINPAAQIVVTGTTVEESRKAVELYSQRLIPTAEQNVAAARTNYEVGKLNFLQLAQTQRQLITIRERQIESLISYHRRAAELWRVTGGSVPQSP